MKRKGITIWELYLERIVLGVAALFFLGFTAFQFMSAPNTVQDVAPNEIDEQIATVADGLSGQLSENAGPTAEIPPYEPVVERFSAKLNEPVSPSKTIDAVVYSPSPGVGGDEVVQQGGLFHVPAFPAPTEVAAVQNYGAIRPETVSQSEELQDRYPTVPHDATWLTAFAVISQSEILAALEASTPDASDIPAAWYGGRATLFDVIVEREELVNGSWINATTIEPIPGQFGFRRQLQGTPTKSDRDAIVNELSIPGAQERLLRPPFYELVGAPWEPTDPRNLGAQAEQLESQSEMTDDQRRLAQLERRLRREAESLANIEKRLRELGGSPPRPGRDDQDEERQRPGGDRDERDRNRRDPGGGGDGDNQRRGTPGGKRQGAPGGGLGDPSGPGGGGGQQEEERKQASLERLERQYLRKESSIRRLTGKVNDLRDQLQMPPLGEEDVRVDVVVDPLGEDDVVIWAHDLDVEADRTYRYRFTVAVQNPFFARKLDLVAEQQMLAEDATIRSASSGWSSPVEVQAPTRVFVTKAYGPEDERGNNRVVGASLEMGRATVEVFRFESGRWWQYDFKIVPGQRVGERQVPRNGDGSSVDFATSWFVLDIMPAVNAGLEERSQGYGATVMLQHTRDSERTFIGRPLIVRDDPERDMLQQLVESADADAEAAAAADSEG